MYKYRCSLVRFLSQFNWDVLVKSVGKQIMRIRFSMGKSIDFFQSISIFETETCIYCELRFLKNIT